MGSLHGCDSRLPLACRQETFCAQLPAALKGVLALQEHANLCFTPHLDRAILSHVPGSGNPLEKGATRVQQPSAAVGHLHCDGETPGLVGGSSGCEPVCLGLKHLRLQSGQ